MRPARRIRYRCIRAAKSGIFEMDDQTSSLTGQILLMRRANMRNAYLILLATCVVCGLATAGEKAQTDSPSKRAHTTELPDFDKIRIYALSGEPFRGDEGFPIRPYDGAVCKIVDDIEVSGKQAEEICKLWRTLSDEPNRAFCHSPPYGFRFYRGDEMVYETSMCWKCNNFYGPNDDGKQIWYGLKKDKQSAMLLKLCKKLLPHPNVKK